MKKEANGLDEFVNMNLVGTALAVLSDDRGSSVGGVDKRGIFSCRWTLF